jgi:hypothetical protein
MNQERVARFELSSWFCGIIGFMTKKKSTAQKAGQRKFKAKRKAAKRKREENRQATKH